VFKVVFFVLNERGEEKNDMNERKKRRLVRFLYHYNEGLQMQEVVFEWAKVERMCKVTRRVERLLGKYEKVFGEK
jgi:hypothetical protein